LINAKRLSGRIAIVTGGGNGIGEATAWRLSQEGAAVAVADFNVEAAKRVCQRLTDAGCDAISVVTNVLNSESILQLTSDVAKRWGRIDILINSAGGFNQFLPITDISDEEWDKVVALNLRSTFSCCRAVIPFMTEQHYGRIINIASQAGVAPSPNAPSYLPYAAAKAGVIGFTKLLARDVGQFGITVNAISPGTTATERVVRIRGPETLQNMASLNPMRKLVEPEDSAATAAFLASDDARLITGTNINVNAGTVM